MRRKLALFGIVLILFVSAVGAAGTSLELGPGSLSDDFEDGDIEEYDDNTGDDVTAKVDSTQAANGTFSLNITSGTVSNDRDIITNESFDLKPGEDFNISFWVRRDDALPDEQGGGDIANFNIHLKLTDGSEGIQIRPYFSEGTDDTESIFVGGTIVDKAENDSEQIKPDTWILIEVEVDYDTDTVIVKKNGDQVISTALTGNWSNPNDIRLQFKRTATNNDENTTFWWDTVEVDGVANANFTVSGFVKDENGDPIDDADVTVNTTDDSDVTGSDGKYVLGLDNGTYEITASKDGFTDNSTVVTVSGSEVENANITLKETVDISLEVPSHMWHNTTASYTVTNEDTGGDITDEATVTSADPVNLSVNEETNKLEATDDLSFSGEITITAEFKDATVSKNVTIGNKTAENIDILQNGADRFSALWGDPLHPDTDSRTGGTQLTMRIIFIALLAGIATTEFSSAFGGVGAITLVMLIGWFMGWVGTGMALVTVFAGLFIGLNVAANVDYGVQRSS